MTARDLAPMIAQLRVTCGRIQRLNTEGRAYKRLESLLARADEPTLIAIRDAEIKWLSQMAVNRLRMRGRV